MPKEVRDLISKPACPQHPGASSIPVPTAFPQSPDSRQEEEKRGASSIPAATACPQSQGSRQEEDQPAASLLPLRLEDSVACLRSRGSMSGREAMGRLSGTSWKLSKGLIRVVVGSGKGESNED